MVVAFDIGVGSGQTVRIEAPERAAYSNNLGGALQYGAVNSCYKLLEVMGGALGAFVAGVGVQFMERVEPSLVHYARPLIDMLLGQSELDPTLRTFFEELREPQHEGAAVILGGMATQVGGAVMGNALGPILAPLTYALNRAMRPAILGVTELVTAYRRNLITHDTFLTELARHGFPDGSIEILEAVTQQRAGVGDLLTGYKRGTLPEAELVGELRKQGTASESIALWLANARELLGVQTLVDAWHRGVISESDLRSELSTRKFTDDDIDTLLTLSRPIPGPGDLVRMGLREAFRDDVAQEWSYDEDFPPDLETYLGQQGFTPEWAKYYWRAHWSLPSVGQGFEMMHRDIITPEQLESLLRISDIPAKWREYLIAMSYRPLTRVDVRRMHDMGVLTTEEVNRSYRDLGYDATNAQRMTDFTVAYNDRTGDGELTEYRDLTRSVIIQAYQKGVISRDQAETRLLGLDYEMEGIDILLSLADWEQDLSDTPDYRGEYQKDIRQIVEKAYSQRVLSNSEAMETLQGVGYGDTEATYLLTAVDFWYGMDQTAEVLKTVGEAYVRRGITRSDALSGLGRFGISSDAMQQKMNEWDTQRNIRSRRLTEAAYRKALKTEIITPEEYQENLRGLGYTEYDIWVSTAMAIGIETAGTRPTSGPLSQL